MEERKKVYRIFFVALALIVFLTGGVLAQSAQYQILDLKEGWNFISFNKLGDNKNIMHVFADNWDKIDVIKTYRNGQFVEYNKPNGVETLNEVDFDEGYKIHISPAFTMYSYGYSPQGSNYVLQLKEGSNYIGYPFETSIDVEDFFSSIESKLEGVKSLDGGLYAPGVIKSFDELEPGKGYEVVVTDDVDFTYPYNKPTSEGGGSGVTTSCEGASNYFKKGELEIKYSNGGRVTGHDYCFDSSVEIPDGTNYWEFGKIVLDNGLNIQETSTGEYLFETTCKKGEVEGENIYLQAEIYKCPEGCSNGACIQAEETRDYDGENPSVETDSGIADYNNNIVIGKMKIVPEKQYTNEGEAVYQVSFTDSHERCSADKETGCAQVIQQFDYKIDFGGAQGLSGTFSEDEFTLTTGSTKQIELKVLSEKEGTNYFVVSIIDENGDVAGKALASITYVSGQEYPQKSSPEFFVGSGVALSTDGNDGLLMNFVVLNTEGVLTGKINTLGHAYKIEGTVVNSNTRNVGVESSYGVEFDIISFSDDIPGGSFIGEMKKYGEFNLLKGIVTGMNEAEWKDWELTAFSKKVGVVRSIPIGQRPSDVSVNEVVSVDQDVESVDDDVLLRPIEVRDRKILWIIPAGKVLDVEVVQRDQITKTEIPENGYKEIQGYKISVGELREGESIRFNVE